MKTKQRISWLTAVALLSAGVGASGGPAAGEEAGASAGALTGPVFAVNANNATAESVVRMIGAKAGLSVQVEGDLSKRVSYSLAGTTLENALQRMAGDVGFTYSVRGGVLQVSKFSGNRGPASLDARLIELKYADAEELGLKLKGYIGQGADIHVDKKMNSLVFVGSDASFNQARKFVALFDRMPQQILIEAKIVEANDTFSREIGVLLGDLAGTDMNNNSRATGFSNPGFSTSPANFGLKYKFGVTTGRNLDVRLMAAESRGDAKVVSRPKVVTINNTRALVNSGITLNVKTLSTVQTAQGSTATTSTPSGTVAGGLEQVQAGLQLGVLPSVVDASSVRLVVDVNNSQPDTQYTVDGVPGISTNAANTSVIVEDNATAVIAGLIRNSESHGRKGVPFLSDIPILGLLFRTQGRTDRNDEMMIFITPHILHDAEGVKRAQAEAEALLPEKLPEAAVRKPAAEEKKEEN